MCASGERYPSPSTVTVLLTSKLGLEVGTSVGALLGLNEGTNVGISVEIKLGLGVGPLEVGPTVSMNTGSTETVTVAVSHVNSTPSSKHASYSKSRVQLKW